jgi:UrcA family protein
MNAKRILLAAALGIVLVAPAAHGADGVWRVGDRSYVIRHDGLDLAVATDRQELLDMIETGARRLCRNERTRARREGCEAGVVEGALSDTSQSVRDAVSEARLERDERRWAQR